MFIENTEKSNLANDGTFFGKSGVAEDEATGQGDGTAGKKTAPQDRPKCLLCWNPIQVFLSSASSSKEMFGCELSERYSETGPVKVAVGVSESVPSI